MPDDADLISIIQSCYRDLKKTIMIHWVRGHQDAGATKQPLSIASKLNIQADALATDYRKKGRLKPSLSTSHEYEQGCSILINGERLTSQYDDCTRFHVNGYHLRRYVQEKQQSLVLSFCTHGPSVVRFLVLFVPSLEHIKP